MHSKVSRVLRICGLVYCFTLFSFFSVEAGFSVLCITIGHTHTHARLMHMHHPLWFSEVQYPDGVKTHKDRKLFSNSKTVTHRITDTLLTSIQNFLYMFSGIFHSELRTNTWEVESV